METKTNYTLVGLFVIALTAGIIIISLWLYDALNTKSYRVYATHIYESVSGLNIQAPVKYNGVDVGYVRDIRLNLKNPSQVIVIMNIESKIPITTNTTASLMEQGITGITYIGLRGMKGAELIKPQPGEKYPVIKSEPSFLTQLDATLRNLNKHVSNISTRIQKVLSNQNIDEFRDIMKNVDTITTTIADNHQHIDETIKNLEIFMHNTAKVSEQFPGLARNIQSGTTSLKTMADNISATTKTLNGTVTQTDIAIQSFSNQITPKLYDALDNINELANNLKEFTNNLNQNPSILIRGQKQPPLGPGEH